MIANNWGNNLADNWANNQANDWADNWANNWQIIGDIIGQITGQVIVLQSFGCQLGKELANKSEGNIEYYANIKVTRML